MSEMYLPEHIIISVVQKAKQTYKTKESRLEFCGAILGRQNISEPDVFYNHYFEEKKDV